MRWPYLRALRMKDGCLLVSMDLESTATPRWRRKVEVNWSGGLEKGPAVPTSWSKNSTSRSSGSEPVTLFLRSW